MSYSLKQNTTGSLIEFRFKVQGGYENIRQHQFEYKITEQEVEDAIEEVKSEFGVADIYGKFANANITRILKAIELKRGFDEVEYGDINVALNTGFKKLAHLLKARQKDLYANSVRIKINKIRTDLVEFSNSVLIFQDKSTKIHVLDFHENNKTTKFIMEIDLPSIGKDKVRYLIFIQDNEITNINKVTFDALLNLNK